MRKTGPLRKEGKTMQYRDHKLTETIIQSIIRVHQVLGPGFLESIYRKAMVIELRRRGLAVETEKEVLVFYEGEEVGVTASISLWSAE